MEYRRYFFTYLSHYLCNGYTFVDQCFKQTFFLIFQVCHLFKHQKCEVGQSEIYICLRKRAQEALFLVHHIYRSILLHILSDKWMFAAFINRYSLLDQQKRAQRYILSLQMYLKEIVLEIIISIGFTVLVYLLQYIMHFIFCKVLSFNIRT